MNRREFIKQSIGATAALAVGGLSAAAKAASPPSTGITLKDVERMYRELINPRPKQLWLTRQEMEFLKVRENHMDAILRISQIPEEHLRA